MKINLAKFIDSSYDVHFCETIDDIVRDIAQLSIGTRYFIVTGENVNKLYGEDFLEMCEAKKLDTVKIVIPTGEENKDFEVAEGLLESVLSYPVDRNAVLIALGGGITGDVAGFAASLLMRGIHCIQVPTTLLAQVDASIGGKTGVNSQFGKNLIGTFHQPSAVFICPAFFKTLDARNWSTGLAEVVKYAVCFDELLFEFLERNTDKIMERNGDIMTYVVEKSIKIKAAIVEQDEKEHGIRRLLNFGHTLGHAVEAYHEYERYNHGEAVSIGMVYAGDLSIQYTNFSLNEYKRLVALLEKCGLPTQVPDSVKDYVAFIGKDKKGDGDVINWVLLEQIGKAALHKIETSKLK